jgi:hypothetical protein
VIALVWELVCDHSECNSLLHFDEHQDIHRARAIARMQYDWRWSLEKGDICPKHKEDR